MLVLRWLALLFSVWWEIRWWRVFLRGRLELLLWCAVRETLWLIWLLAGVGWRMFTRCRSLVLSL